MDTFSKVCQKVTEMNCVKKRRISPLLSHDKEKKES